MRIALVTDRAWKSLPERVVSLSKKISALLPETVEIVTLLRPVGNVPIAKDGRVDRAFLKRILKADGYDGACLLFERRQARDLKLALKGFYLRDEDGYIEFFVCANERTTDKSYFGNFRFERAFAHELLHGLYHWVGAKFPTPDEKAHHPGYDNTHYLDKTTSQIEVGYREVAKAWPKRPKSVTILKSTPDPLKGVDPNLADLARRTIRAMAELGKPVFVFEGFRSMERQAELYAQGRTKPGKIVTNAKPGESKHNHGKAVDIIFEKTLWSNPRADWDTLGTVFKSLAKARNVKVSWGGDWKGFPDLPHFEL